MITDKIKFAPGFAKEDSKTFASAGVEAKGIEPARIWRNITNISVWPRFTDAITDILYEDSADNDPHLFDKAQFYFDTTTGDRVRCQVIYFVHPKEDRAARLAIQGTVFNPNGKQINEVVFEVMVGVRKVRRLTNSMSKAQCRSRRRYPTLLRSTMATCLSQFFALWSNGVKNMIRL